MQPREQLHRWPLQRATVWWLAVAAIAAPTVACSAGPVPIEYGVDSCDYCRMQISDPRYGGELVMRTGKVLKFDSIECLASYYSGLEESSVVRSRWVSDYHNPGTLIAADEAIYIHRDGPGSPMGRGLLALAAGADETVPGGGSAQGDTLSWAGVVELVMRDSLMSRAVPAAVLEDTGSGTDGHAH